MKEYFTGKTVLVTGSSSGIGAATAEQFASFGAQVCVTGRNQDNVKKIAEKCRQLTNTRDKILEIVADVSKDDDLKRIIDEIIKTFGKLDVLVNNAGTSAMTKLGDANSLDEYDRIMNTNVRSVVRLTHYALPHLEKTKGSIVNVSSVASFKAHKAFFVYCMSKSAIDMFTKCSAIDLGPKQIRINAVNPAIIITPIFERTLGFGEKEMEGLNKECLTNYPLGRPGQPEEVANAIAFLASDKASFITGATLDIDGGSMFTSAGCAAQFD